MPLASHPQTKPLLRDREAINKGDRPRSPTLPQATQSTLRVLYRRRGVWGTLELGLDDYRCPMGDPIKSTIHFCRAGLSLPQPLKGTMGPDDHAEL